MARSDTLLSKMSNVAKVLANLWFGQDESSLLYASARAGAARLHVPPTPSGTDVPLFLFLTLENVDVDFSATAPAIGPGLTCRVSPRRIDPSTTSLS